MANKPWEEKIVDDKSSNKAKRSGISTSWITGILSVFFIIIVAIVFIVFYTSNRGEDKASETAGFFGASSAQVSTSATTSESTTTDETSASSTETQESSSSSSSVESQGDTIVVQSGEGAGAIAARAGISVDRLQELNPDHMTQGYWYANPGDAVIVN